MTLDEILLDLHHATLRIDHQYEAGVMGNLEFDEQIGIEHQKAEQAIEALIKQAKIDELYKACRNWEDNPTLPATYLIGRLAELQTTIEQPEQES